MRSKMNVFWVLVFGFGSQVSGVGINTLKAQNQSWVKQAALQDFSYLESLYKHCHIHPELSFQELETAKRMASELKSLGFDVTTQVGGNGVVGVLQNGKGPVVMVRCDMDALPVVEQTGKEYASNVQVADETGKTVGVMHACGHDMHMTVWVGTARLLATNKAKWKGTLVFIAQPAEERSGGALNMLKDGLYERFPRPDYVLGLHVSAQLETGKVGYCPEYSMANVDMMDITIKGHGGHGAYPHTTIDPIVLAARMIMAWQTIVSRELSPLEPAVVTVGSIHGGAKGNVIPDEVKLELTMRSYSDAVRKAIVEKIKRIGNAEALSAGWVKTTCNACHLSWAAKTSDNMAEPTLKYPYSCTGWA